VLQKVINKINLRTDKVKIKDVRQTKAKSVIMEFEMRGDLQKFKDHQKLKTLYMEKSKKRNSLLILYNVDSSLTAYKLTANII
jgi:hypothetical protein